MLKDSRYLVVKPIPLDARGDKNIPKGTSITVTNGNVYKDGGFINPDYQEDFRTLIKTEMKNGWNYLRPDNPVVGKSIIGNVKE